MPSKEYKAVVFDIDGLLLDTEVFQYKVWVQLLKDAGIAPEIVEERFSEQHYATKYAGVSAELNAESIIGEFGLEGIVAAEQFMAQRDEILDGFYKSEKVNYMPGALDALMYFIENGIPIVLATSGDEFEAKLKLKKSGLAKLVDKYDIKVISRSKDMKGKPSPDIHLAASKALGYAPIHILAFEDSRPGYDAAMTAGMTCFAVATKWTSPNLPDEEIPTRFESLLDAVEHIKKNYFFHPSADSTS